MILPCFVTQKAFSTEFPALALLKSHLMIHVHLHLQPKFTGWENLQLQNSSPFLLHSHHVTALFHLNLSIYGSSRDLSALEMRGFNPFSLANACGR